MKSSESMAALYSIILKMTDPSRAREFVSDSVYVVISELQDENIEITPEAIEEKLSHLAEDFIEASKKKDAA